MPARKRAARNSSKAKMPQAKMPQEKNSNVVKDVPKKEANLRLEIKNVYQACGFQNGKSGKTSQKTSPQGPKYWASGTGYGNDSTTTSEWNINAYIDTQSKQSDAVQTSLTKIKNLLLLDLKLVSQFEENTSREIEKFLVPVIEYYLFDVSFLDMENFSARFIALFDILESLASRIQLQHLMLPQKDRTKCIYSILKSLKSQMKIMVLENKKKDESSAFLLEFAKKVNLLSDMLKEIKKRTSLSVVTINSNSSATTSTSTSTSTETTTLIQKPLYLYQRAWQTVTSPCQRCLRKKTLPNTPKETSPSDTASPITEPLLPKEKEKAKEEEKETIKEKQEEKEQKTEIPKEQNNKQEKKAKGKKEKKKQQQKEKEEKKLIVETPIKVETKEETKQLEEKYMETLKNYRFRYINDFNSHHYVNDTKSQVSTPKFLRRLQSEYIDLSKSLPIHLDASVFVRAKESNISLAQMMIMPSNGPYQRGAFLFDVHFPSNYPTVPPHVNLQTTGKCTFRFNPNLYACGKVCLSLLGTWHGRAGEGWQADISTLLQVAVSIMSQIFVDEPFYNEPGYEYQMHTAEGKKQSDQYSSNVRNATIKYAMIEQIEKPPKGFEYITLNHFYLNKDRIIRQVRGWVTDDVSKNPSNMATLAKELPGLVDKLTKLLTELKEPVPPKDDDDDEEED